MIQKLLIKSLTNLSSYQRKIILILIDLLLIKVSFEIVLFILPDFFLTAGKNIILQNVILIIAFFIYFFTGQYRSLARYIGSKNIYLIAFRNLVICLSLFISNIIFIKVDLSLKFLLLLWTFLSLLVGSSKFIFRDILISASISKLTETKHVIIYGAGKLGAQLASILGMEDLVIDAFIDDNEALWKRSLYGTKIIPFKEINKFVKKIDQIYISTPKLSKKKKREIYNIAFKNNIKIFDINSIEDLASGNINKETFTPIKIEKILGRDTVKPREDYIGNGVKDKVICITGAGGSIGSEIARRCFEQKPSKLILIDNCEANLFYINDELLEKCKVDSLSEIPIYPLLANATDQFFLEKTFISEKVEIVFHAAAYKHVPLVEVNPIEGIKNNFLSVKAVCKAAIKAGVNKALLISTDKAVRPTNIMGATKRLSELIVKKYSIDYFEKKHNTIFSCVRFGNVLGSSGSVVPKFKKQIANGGPITITHKDVVRYFMTIEEASELVLQTVFLSKGGEIFLLDMGKPVKIFDLAKQMIYLSGLTVKNKNNNDGDIEIIKIGLRPGEKLYEELLISGESLKTKHPLIYKEKDDATFQKIKDLEDKLLKLELYISNNDCDKILSTLGEIVPEWVRAS